MASQPPRPPDSESGGLSGQLSETPLFVVLRRIQRDRLSGTLSVLRDDQVRQLFFENGELRAARSSREDHRIGATLVRWGYISEGDLQKALEIQKRGPGRIDQILVEMGVVTRAIVDSEARRQMEQIIFSTLAWPDGAFHFEPDTGTGQLDVTLSFSQDVIIEAIRRIPESEQFVELLGDLKALPRLTKDPMSSVSFRLLKDAFDVLGHVDGKTAFETLLESPTTSGSAAAKILYSLMFAGLIDARPPEPEPVEPLGFAIAAPSARVSAGAAPAAEASAERPADGGAHAVRHVAPVLGAAQAARQIVLDTYRQLDWLSHYDLLGVSRKATPAEIDAAHKGRSRLFDPSLKTHPELVDLWRQLTVLAKWLKVAYGVLSNPVTRAAYDQKIEESTPSADGASAGAGTGTRKPG